MSNCPICQRQLKHDPDLDSKFDCERCGSFQIVATGHSKGIGDLLTDPGPTRRRRANLSHKVRRRTRRGEHVPVILGDLPEKWGLDDPLHTLSELLDELILWVGDNAATFTEAVSVSDKARLAAWLGLPIDVNPGHPDRAVDWLLKHSNVTRYVEIPDRSGPLALKLTWDGWARYDDLKRRESKSYTAFMAMKFGHPDLDDVIDTCFKPAVATTGFTLKRVTDDQGAGLIDDQMRVGIRTSRFVIADLTHNSRGAYWEAGFAEGLGRPVLYTCRKDQWEEERSHFDTNHLVTIAWDPGDLNKAAREIKAAIRATLPDVAKMTD